jgi:hypothetical protein
MSWFRRLFGGAGSRSEGNIPRLITRLNIKDEAERKRARASLVAMGEVALDALIQSLNSDVWNIRMNAAIALGNIKNPRAVEPLLRGLNEDIRIQAIVALGEIGDSRAEQPLHDALQDPNEIARAFAAEALGKMGHREPLIEALDDTSEFVKQTAIQALAQCADPTIATHISRVMRNAGDWATRYLAAKTLGELKYATAEGPLREALTDSDEMVRQAAKHALQELSNVGRDRDYWLRTKERPTRDTSDIDSNLLSDIDRKNQQTSLHIAAASNQLDVAQELRRRGVETNTRNIWGATPLHLAVSNNNYEMVQLLLRNGAKVAIKSNEGKTPLELAKALGRSRLVTLLQS